jgi:hypothetical protein
VALRPKFSRGALINPGALRYSIGALAGESKGAAVATAPVWLWCRTGRPATAAAAIATTSVNSAAFKGEPLHAAALAAA